MTLAMRFFALGMLVLWIGAGEARAQQGDRADEDRATLPNDLVVPPAVVRTPTEELATFVVQKGYRLELVASEPLLSDPVQAVFDGDGRLWVVEMRSYMRTVDAEGEHTPDGRISVLRDHDGDGRMDEAVPFLDGLVLPRAVLPMWGGALVIEPPHLLWATDADNDLRAERTEVVCSGFDSGLNNPEHSGNGLLWGLDNRIHLADDARTLRLARTSTGVSFAIERTALAGQWGIAQDDRGRLYFNYNEDWLRCDLVPRHYGARTSPSALLPGQNHRLLPDPSVFPGHMTPGVNRGGRAGMLKDGYLQRHTAVCAPLVYRGAQLPECSGDVFVCEPAGNLVRRIRLADVDGRMVGVNAHDRAEFLTSSDERFRPVNLSQGPDGGLYVVDMYRGVIQHKNFVTTFLRTQIKDRALERPIGLGRIWRIVAEGVQTPLSSPSAGDDVRELVAQLSDDNGMRRDRAQQRLCELKDIRSVLPLREVLRTAAVPASLHALATLEGISELRCDDLRRALHGKDPGLLCLALQFAAPELSRGDRVLASLCEALVDEGPPCVLWQLALTMGDVEGPLQPRAFEVLARLAARSSADAILAGAVASSAREQPMELVQALTAMPFADDVGAAMQAHARDLALRREPDLHEAVLQRAAACMDRRQQLALLRGLTSAIPAEQDKAHGFFVFVATPPSLAAMVRTGDPSVVAEVQRVLAAMELRVTAVNAPASDADLDLTPDERARVAAGARVYGAYCAACHQHEGQGLPGLAPPLRDSEWVLSDPERLLKVTLHGVRGPLRAAGTAFDGEMPSQAHLGDADLAAALSWLRRAFGHRASCIDEQQVRAMRERHQGRITPWSASELQPR